IINCAYNSFILSSFLLACPKKEYNLLHLYSLNSTISKSLLIYKKEEGFIMKKVYFATKADVERLYSFFGQANKKDDKI
ncbi:hypothetical protein ACT453_58425, partial [Bacillus sp. D-CC]